MISRTVANTLRMLRPTSPFSYGLPEVCWQFLSSGRLNASHHTAVMAKMTLRQVSIGTPAAFMPKKMTSGMVEPPMYPKPYPIVETESMRSAVVMSVRKAS